MNKKHTRRSPKRRYRLRNWREYNTALVDRGRLTVWVDEEATRGWVSQQKTGKRGASPLYTSSAILCALTLKEVYHLPLRAAEGLLRSVFELMQVGLPVPDYTTLSRRSRTLQVPLGRLRSGEPLHLVIDSSGFKVYGEGEWKVRAHGWSKRRTWRKLHLCVDADTQQIEQAVVSTADVNDAEVLPQLLESVEEPVASVAADGIYDQERCYQAIQKIGARPLIPPRRGARIRQHGNCKADPLPRDENLRAIRKRGRARWKRECGYHQRSLAETAMFRMKTLFSDRVAARLFDNQATELFVRCRALNRMTKMGMPDSYPV